MVSQVVHRTERPPSSPRSRPGTGRILQTPPTVPTTPRVMSASRSPRLPLPFAPHCPPQGTPREEPKLDHPKPPQTSAVTALNAGDVRKSWKFLGSGDLGISPRTKYPTPPLEMYRTASRIRRMEADENARLVTEFQETFGERLEELVDQDDASEQDDHPGTEPELTKEQMRNAQNVSPTRRNARVVMAEAMVGLLHDQETEWLLKYDPRDAAAPFPVGCPVTYNRQRDANGFYTAVRLMRAVRRSTGFPVSPRRRTRSGSLTSIGSASFSNSLGLDLGTGDKPTDGPPMALRRRMSSRVMSKELEKYGQALREQAVQKHDGFGVGLEYHNFLRKAKGLPITKIKPGDPDSIDKVIQELVQATGGATQYGAILLEAELDRLLGEGEEEDDGKYVSVFTAEPNRAPDEEVAQWMEDEETMKKKKKKAAETMPANQSVAAMRHSYWFRGTREGVENYDSQAKTARERSAREQAAATHRAQLAESRLRANRPSRPQVMDPRASLMERKNKQSMSRRGSLASFSARSARSNSTMAGL